RSTSGAADFEGCAPAQLGPSPVVHHPRVPQRFVDQFHPDVPGRQPRFDLLADVRAQRADGGRGRDHDPQVITFVMDPVDEPEVGDRHPEFGIEDLVQRRPDVVEFDHLTTVRQRDGATNGSSDSTVAAPPIASTAPSSSPKWRAHTTSGWAQARSRNGQPWRSMTTLPSLSDRSGSKPRLESIWVTRSTTCSCVSGSEPSDGTMRRPHSRPAAWAAAVGSSAATFSEVVSISASIR